MIGAKRQGAATMFNQTDSRPGHAVDPPAGLGLTTAGCDRDERALAELITVFFDPGQAVLLARRAGFPRALLPAFTTSWAFWTEVTDKACDGVLPNGARALFEHAAQMVPNNAAFAGYLDGPHKGSSDVTPDDAELPSAGDRRRIVRPPPLVSHPSPWMMAMFLILGFVLAAWVVRLG